MSPTLSPNQTTLTPAKSTARPRPASSGEQNAASQRVPVLDLAPEIDLLWDEIQAALRDVVRSGQFILGPQVRAFEEETARYLGVKHAVGCNSGTDALILALRAAGIGPGDDVLTTSFTFFATAEAVSLVGARPVFVDLEPGSFNIDPARLEQAITPRTRAILPVHLFGRGADMPAINEIARRHGLLVIEDAAQAFGGTAHGVKAGTSGHAGAFSFFPSKNLGAFGDGGLLATNDDRIADLARMLRAHGSKRKYENEMLGYNSRLDELQAAVLRVKLPHVDAWNERRRHAALLYNRLLADVAWIRTPDPAEGSEHVFHQYTIRIVGRDRDAVRDHLDRRGIGTMVYYPVPVHRLPVYAGQLWRLPATDEAAQQVLSLPIGPFLDDAAIARVVEALKSA